MEQDHIAPPQTQALRPPQGAPDLLDAVPVFILAKDRAGRILFVNETLARATGRPKEAWPGRPAQELFPTPPAAADDAAVLASGQPRRDIVEPLETAAGRRWVLTEKRPLHDGQGALIGVLCSAVDVTERRQAEQALRESEERYRRLFETETDAILLLDGVSGQILDANLAATQLYGYSRAELLGLQVVAISAEPEKTRQALSAGDTATALRWHRKKNGEMFPVEIAGSCFEERGRRLHVAAIRDITRHREAEEMLQTSALRYKELFEHSGTSITIIDEYGTYLLVNQAAARVFGRPAAEVVGQSLFDLLPAAAAREQFSRNRDLLAAGGRREYEAALPLAGHGRTFLIVDRCLQDTGGRNHAIQSSAVDITERKHAEAQLHALAARLQAVRDEERARMARELHDELGQSLTSLQLDLVWLGKRLPPATELHAKAAALLALADDLTRRTQRICSELRSAVLEDLGLADAIQAHAEQFAQRSGVACEVVRPDQEPAVTPDEARALFRAFQEALTNVARHARATRVVVRLTADAAGVRLEVSDNGRGIAPAELARSSALGLLGLRERMQACGGTVAVDGGPGRGTTVALQIPRKEHACTS